MKWTFFAMPFLAFALAGCMSNNEGANNGGGQNAYDQSNPSNVSTPNTPNANNVRNQMNGGPNGNEGALPGESPTPPDQSPTQPMNGRLNGSGM